MHDMAVDADAEVESSHGSRHSSPHRSTGSPNRGVPSPIALSVRIAEEAPWGREECDGGTAADIDEESGTNTMDTNIAAPIQSLNAETTEQNAVHLQFEVGNGTLKKLKSFNEENPGSRGNPWSVPLTPPEKEPMPSSTEVLLQEEDPFAPPEPKETAAAPAPSQSSDEGQPPNTACVNINGS